VESGSQETLKGTEIFQKMAEIKQQKGQRKVSYED